MGITAEGLIPARFLTLLSHLAIIILIFSSRKENINSCLNLESSETDYNHKDTQLLIGLISSILLLAIELLGFLSGVSMFMPSAALISVAGHFSGSIALSYFVLDQWDCDLFWWVFALCSVLPALSEIIVIVGVLALNKS